MSKKLTPKGYMPRVVDAQIEEYLEIFGAVEVAGTKWCGKTWTALSHGASVSYIDDDYKIALADPQVVTLGEQPHVIDEWQLVPAIWDAVRRDVDKERGLRGGWLLTGSSTPFNKDADDTPKHSGAGRIGKVRMYPMSLAESGDSDPGAQISLKDLFEGKFPPGKLSGNAKDAIALVELTCRGGWPEVIDLNARQAQRIAQEYLRILFQKTTPKHGLSEQFASRLLTSIARTLGQAASQKTLYQDMTGEEVDTLSSYQKALLLQYTEFFSSVYLLEEIPGWVPPTRSPKRLSVKPKRYLADPSLAIAQLGMGPEALMKDWQTFGLMFENLCIRDLLVHASALPNIGLQPVRYYRDDSGLEVDAIIELTDGRWGAFEIKVSEDAVADGVDNLKRLRKKVSENPKAKTRPPEFMAVLVGLSNYAREVEDGIYVIPLRALC